MPSAVPTSPPMIESVIASTRNWRRMSLLRAPIALRIPISRVRSRTETSMMFMIPIPPTTSEIDAMPARSAVRIAVTLPTVLRSCAWFVIEKSSASAAASSWRVRSSAVIAFVTSVIWSGDATLTSIVRTLSEPVKYFSTVAIGTRIWSSWLTKPTPPLG